MAVKDWSTTAADNDDADATINWLEGQSPATVNNSARALMAAVASWRDLIDYGTVSGGTVGGSANAITLTCSPTVSAREAGRRYLFKYTSTGTTGAVTLVVDGLTSGAIQYLGSALVSGDIATNDWVLVVDDGTNFQLLSGARVSGLTVINGTTAKSAIAASDKFAITDSAASDVPKHILWSSLIASQSAMEAATSIVAAVTPGRMQYHPGVVKAWANFVPRGTNGTCTLNGSYNITSVTRSAAGIYDVLLDTDMSSANYCVTVQCDSSSNLNLMYNVRTRATTGFTISQLSASASTASDLGDAIHFVVLGDQ